MRTSSVGIGTSLRVAGCSRERLFRCVTLGPTICDTINNMRTYEHLVLPVHAIKENPADEAAFLDEMGEQGWTLMGVVPGWASTEIFRWVFRRPVIEGRE